MTSRIQAPSAVVVTPASPECSRAHEPLQTVPTDIYTIQQQQTQPVPIRRNTPAASFSLRTQKTHEIGKSDSYGKQLPNMRKVSEEDLSPDDLANSEPEEAQPNMSAAAQAAALSAFLSVNSSDSDEAETHARITDVYREPLDLDGLENLVLGILRTGKLTIQGTPGDVTKIQPALFALQANEKDIPQLLPQVIQSPLFNQMSFVAETTHSNSSLSICNPDALQNGHIRLGMYVDTAIYTLLKGHCAKNAKQAEAIITTLMTTNYIPVDPFKLQMPPMIFPASMARQVPPPVGTNGSSRIQAPAPSNRNVSSSSMSSASSMSMQSSGPSNSSLEENTSRATTRVESDDRFEENGSPQPSIQKKRTRRTSKVHPRPLRSRSSSSDFSDDEGMQFSWKSSIIDNSTLVCQYGSNSSYPLLMWNPKLTVDLQVKSSLGLLCGTVTGVDPSQPTVTVRVFNNSSCTVAFSIRSFRQSTIFNSHVVYPTKGLHILEKGKSWEDNVELYTIIKGTSEIFVIDLLVCTMNEHPSWNIHRKYAAMRGIKNESGKSQTHLSTRRLTKKRASIFYMPGTKEQKEENLKMIISHGLQCVVKGKLDEAEVIFTQAILLPDFQRIELKAFVYICLAVVANKRQSKGDYGSLLPVLNEVTAASQLVDALDATPGTARMPRMIQLVKQLKKELDVPKIFTNFRQGKVAKKMPRVDDVQSKETEIITEAGGTLSCSATTVYIHPNSLKAPTQITVSTPDLSQLNSMVRQTGWSTTVKIITAVHIDCNPVLGALHSPLEVTAILPKVPKIVIPQCLRLVHSNYLRHWQDITDDPDCSVEISGDKAFIKADRPGWFAVTSVQFDPSLIVVKALRQSLSAEPIPLHFLTYGLNFPECNSLQVAAFISPKVASQEKPRDHIPIAFPHVAQAYPGEQLRLTFEGQLEPQITMNETDLSFEFTVQTTDTIVCEKWLKLTSAAASPFNAKIIVSCCRGEMGNWEKISEIRLSSKTALTNSSSCDSPRTGSTSLNHK